jgi:DNA replication protein DnaC
MSTDFLFERARRLRFHGLIEHWSEVQKKDWVESLLQWEEIARHQRSLERRRSSAHIEKFKPLALFDWGWPSQCDRDAIEGWMRLNFIKEAINPILCGPNGIGKTMIACNVAHEALLQGYTVHFTTASQMLHGLERLDSDTLLRQRIKYYIHPALLIIDGIGMLSYTSRHADLLFEVIHNRYEKKSTFITMTKSFPEWRDVFPNASSVVSIIDRLVHHSKIVTLDGPSFRLKESNANVLSSPNQEIS